MVTKKVSKPVVKTTASQTAKNYAIARLTEWSTWAGLLTIGATIATGGTASWLNSSTLPVLTAGLGLIFNREGG